MAQRVRQPVDAVTGLPIPVESHSNPSTAEKEKHQRAEVRPKGKRGTLVMAAVHWVVTAELSTKREGAPSSQRELGSRSLVCATQQPHGTDQNTTSVFHSWHNNENLLESCLGAQLQPWTTRNPSSGSCESCHCWRRHEPSLDMKSRLFCYIYLKQDTKSLL